MEAKALRSVQLLVVVAQQFIPTAFASAEGVLATKDFQIRAVTNSSWSVVSGPLSVVRCQWSVVSGPLSVVRCQYQSRDVNHGQFTRNASQNRERRSRGPHSTGSLLRRSDMFIDRNITRMPTAVRRSGTNSSDTVYLTSTPPNGAQDCNEPRAINMSLLRSTE